MQFCLVCNAGYHKNGDACVMCTGNEIKSAAGDATDCSADTACDGSSHVPNPGHTACGKIVFLGCARFAEILQNLSERQILWSLCSVVFHALTLKLPIQTPLSVVPELPVVLSSHENVQILAKRAHP